MGVAICKFYGVKIGVSYHIILMYYLNYEHTGL